MTENERIDLELATQFVINQPRAREFIWWMLEQCGVYSAHPVVNGETGIREGRRLIGLTVIQQITSVDPTVYPRMMIEAHQRAETRKSIEDERHSETG